MLTALEADSTYNVGPDKLTRAPSSALREFGHHIEITLDSYPIKEALGKAHNGRRT